MFKSARIKLTAWYLAIIMLITLTFSYLVYVSVAKSTQRALDAQRIRLEKQFIEYNVYRLTPRAMPFYDPNTLIEIRQKTFLLLAGINLAIFAIAGSLGYFLAGKTLKPIEEMLEKQKRFISDAAHEIKTPLTAMKTDLEVTLRDRNLNLETAKNTLTSTIEEVDKLNKFTNRLLEQGKYQSNILTNTKENIELATLITNIVNNLKPLAQEKNESIHLETDQITIQGHKQDLEKLFTNLIENAIKYNNVGKNVNIEMYTSNRNAVVKITDQGIGIDDKDILHIFEPFYRADKARTKSEQNGFGLGLAISNEIVKAHNGVIEVKSKLEEGTTFIVKLPLSEASQNI